MASIWNVTNPELKAHRYGGMWKLTLLCASIQVFGLLFLRLLPAGVEEQAALQKNDVSSKVAGGVFVFVLIVSLLFVIVYTLITIIEPSNGSDDGSGGGE